MTQISDQNTDPRWGMVIDVNRCVGCQTCTVACKHANDTVPGVQWRKVLDVETGAFPDVERLFLVTGCQHCEEPPCVPVCPTGATKQRADGLVTMDYDRCIGCASCAVACPYQARTIVHDQRWYYGQETLQEKYVDHKERRGVAQKCTFCIDRVDDGLAAGLTPGVDPDATPACSAACIASAIQFGDFNDPDSNVSRLIRDNDYFQMHAELNTDPQIKYLYSTPAVPGRDVKDVDVSDETLSDPSNPLVGQLQTFWDMRAAMNFILGGFGAGFALISYLLYLTAGLDGETLTHAYVLAGGIIAVGLFFVWLKIGRKLRAPFAILRPQTSWMSREIYAVGVFYLAMLADLAFNVPSLHFLTAAAAIVFLYCQTRILHMSRGIPAWRVRMMPTMLMATGVFEGIGVAALAVVIAMPALSGIYLLSAAGILMAAINALLWQTYLQRARKAGIGPLARGVLAKATPRLHLVGHLLPIVFFAADLLWPGGPMWPLAVAGVFTLAGGAYWKSVLITKAAYQQGYALAKFPQRGSGQFAAPPLV